MTDAEADAMDIVDVLAQVVLVGGAVMLVVGLAAVGSLWYVVRRIRRSRRLRRGVDRGRLTVRAVTADDAGRRLARMRLEVQRSVDATERAIGAAESQGAPVGAMPSVAASLVRTGHQLDDELRLAEIEPDAELRRAWVAWLTDQVAEHARLCADLRRSVFSATMATGPSQLTRAGDHLALEVEALQAWGTSYRTRRAA
ncbi:hypothetical protein KZX45_06560 [Georgenia sp. EYE_87]|uniref:hypothetical protein n=1 Tax=Georgenia sp. EYE_87 TaxID=2853448 RepID=UPI002003944F|nr:hypothetical protein [Georgenia sp. EYE_87]MCK6210204.1 hypothetical protein [Georgenia sp. EYE_87]